MKTAIMMIMQVRRIIAMMREKTIIIAMEVDKIKLIMLLKV